MNEPLDIATLRAVVGIAGLLLGAVLWRLENYGKAIVRQETRLEGVSDRLVRVEERIGNGIVGELRSMKRELERHMDGEERRILEAVQRDPTLRTRATD